MNIKEIAKLVGVSSATVSRVLNNSGYVKAETREKVLQVIKENNYIPSAIARSLSNKETNSIGAIIPDIQNEFFAKLISGITESADRHGYNMVLLNSNEDINKEHEILSMVESQHFKGVIITPVAYNDTITKDFLLRFENVGIPVVLVDRDIRSTSFAGVFVDNFKGAFDGVNELIKANHKRIAIISGPETSRPGKDRYRGYIAALEEQGLDVDKKYIVHGDFKVDKAGIIHTSIGKISMSAEQIFGNAKEFISTVVKLKPAAAKGTYIKSIFISSTMSKGIKIDPKSAE